MDPIETAKFQVQYQLKFWQAIQASLEAAERMPTGQGQIDFIHSELDEHTNSLGLIDPPGFGVVNPVFGLEDALEAE